MHTIAVVVVLVSCVGFSLQEGDHAAFMEKMHALRDECVKETSVNPDLVKKAFHDGEFAEDNNLKCYFKCIYQKMGRMDATGTLDTAKLLDHLPPSVDKAKATETLNKCKEKKSADACQTAYDFAKCMREAIGPMKHN